MWMKLIAGTVSTLAVVGVGAILYYAFPAHECPSKCGVPVSTPVVANVGCCSGSAECDAEALGAFAGSFAISQATPKCDAGHCCE